jgi:sortase A
MKKLTLILLGIIIVGAVTIFASTLTHALVGTTEPELPVPKTLTTSLEAASSTLPVRVSIPSLGVDATIQRVGISRHGTMAVPTNYTDVGWYKYGTIPGHKGSAVMAGHLDNGFGLPGVFKNLSTLKNGDEVIVTEQNGEKLHFKVVDTGTIDSLSTDTQTIFKGDGQARLNLITCEGTWHPESKSYSERRVVYTVLDRIESAH